LIISNCFKEKADQPEEDAQVIQEVKFSTTEELRSLQWCGYDPQQNSLKKKYFEIADPPPILPILFPPCLIAKIFSFTTVPQENVDR
jgi:hypothetical protein